MERSLPFFDIWQFLTGPYFSYLDGRFSVVDLFALHGEHRILTTRLVLFIDAIFFKMQGIFPILAMYGVLAIIALSAVRSAIGSKGGVLQTALGFAIALGLTWSISQCWNLSLPFHIAIPLAHLFALWCYQALSAALAGEEAQRYRWLSLACAADFLAIFSLGSGLVIAIPAVAMAVWLRACNRLLAIFLSFHAALTALYFVGYPLKWAEPYGVLPWRAQLDFATWFLGIQFGPVHASVAGLAVLAVTIASLIVATVVGAVRRTPIDRRIASLLALCLFVLIEVVVASYARAKYGAAPRYTTAAVVSLVCLYAAAWICGANCGAASSTIHAALLILVVPSLIWSNQPFFESEWRRHVAFIDRTTDALRNGEPPPQELAPFLSPTQMQDAIERMRLLKLAPFDCPDDRPSC